MALNPEAQYPGKITPSSAEYPYGSARNITTPGDDTGTPWEAALVNDLFGFQQSLLDAANIVPSGDPDEVGDSQYLEASKVVANQAGDMLNVTLHPFNADNTGVADASTAISNAGTGQTIKKVYLPPGVYRLDSNTSVDSDVDLVLAIGVTFIGTGQITGIGITDQSIMSRTNGVRATVDDGPDGHFGQYISFRKSGVPTADSESDGFLVIATTEQDSSLFDADLVGIGARAYISGSNTKGRAWGLNAFARIGAGGDGLLHAIECNIENGGSDNGVPDSADAKYGINITTKPGSNPATAAIKIGSNSEFHYGLWAAQSALVSSSSKFIELNGLMAVDGQGRIAVGTGTTQEQLRVYKTSGRSQIKVEADGADEASIKFTEAGVRNWTLGHDAGTGSFALVSAEGVSGSDRYFEVFANGNFYFNNITTAGGGEGIFAIANATTVPISNPTGGGIVYVEAGALKYRGSSGTVTTIANA